MSPRVCLLAALLASPAWAQEPAAPQRFDLHSDAVRKIVNDTATTQVPSFQIVEQAPDKADAAKTEPAEFEYVPPEKPPAPVSKPKPRLPDPPPKPEGFAEQAVEILFDELFDHAIGIDDDDGYSDVDFANDMLRCRVQKETRTGAPNVDNCPAAE